MEREHTHHHRQKGNSSRPGVVLSRCAASCHADSWRTKGKAQSSRVWAHTFKLAQRMTIEVTSAWPQCFIFQDYNISHPSFIHHPIHAHRSPIKIPSIISVIYQPTAKSRLMVCNRSAKKQHPAHFFLLRKTASHNDRHPRVSSFNRARKPQARQKATFTV